MTSGNPATPGPAGHSGPADPPSPGSPVPPVWLEADPLTDADLAAYLTATAGHPAAGHSAVDDPGVDELGWLPDPGALDEDDGPGQPAPSPTPAGPTSAGPTSAGPTPAVGPLVEDWPDVTDHDRAGPGGPGFASGSPLDQLEPGPVLAAALDDAITGGLAMLPDDALAGVMLAGRRLESRGTAALLTATAELGRRRAAHPDPRVGEQADTEIAMLLAVSRRAARRLLGSAADLAQLPATTAALWAGQIDRIKADIIGWETGLLDPALAAAAEQLVIEDAPRLTPSQLRARLHRAVLAADPTAARRRVQQALRDARVELTAERSGGTAGLAGRDLPVPGAVAADQRIDAAARALKKAGVDATLPQLRAAVFLGLLTGNSPHTFLPPPDDTITPPPPGPGTTTPPGPGSTTPPQTGTAPPPAGTGTTTPPQPAPGSTTQSPGTESNTHPPAPAPPAPGTGRTHQPPDAAPSSGSRHPSISNRAAGPNPGETAHPRNAADSDNGTNPGSGANPDGGGWPGKLTIRGSVHLTLPLATWLGASSSPGDIAAYGPVTAETSQDLADTIAASPGTRWCLTLTDRAGHAVAHGCATRPPPPRTEPGRLAAWLARLKITPIQAGTCTHAREVPGYRIPESLHHVVKIRQKTCINPVCARPAQACDDDHTLPHHQGGRTCECGLGPACRGCHRTKQTPGWRLEQPSPGRFTWTLPSGRTIIATPGIYPT